MIDKINFTLLSGISLYIKANLFSKTLVIPFEILESASYFSKFGTIYPLLSGEILTMFNSSKYFVTCNKLYGFKEILLIISEKYSSFSSKFVLVYSCKKGCLVSSPEILTM